LSVIILSLRLVLGASLPFRGSVKGLEIVFDTLPELHDYKAPCHTTVKHWAEKVGYYKLHLARERRDGWMVIIDASIQMGDQKCIKILGCPSDKIPIGRPLTLQDVEVLDLRITNELKGVHIAKWLQELSDNIGLIDSICSDEGPEMKCGVRIFQRNNPNTIHVFDTAHKVANFIKAKLKKDERWTQFKKKITHARRSMQNSKISGAMPPVLRDKARYMNVDRLVRWAQEKLDLLDNPKEIGAYLVEFEKYIGWLREYRKDIKRWSMFVTLANKAKSITHKIGVHPDMVDLFVEEALGTELDQEGKMFAVDIANFFLSNLRDVDSYKLYIGSSEILESLFGKLKYMEKDQTSFGFTSLVLASVASVGDLTPEIVEESIKTVTVAEVKKWSKVNIGESVQSFRKRIQGIVRRLKEKVVTKAAGTQEGKIVDC
jgi:hypothetical protein